MIIFLSVLSAVFPSIVLLWYFYRQDRFPEPLGVMLLTFLLGVFSVIPILLIAIPLSYLGAQVPAFQNSALGLAAFTAFGLAAIPEESFKYLVLTRYAARHSAFDEPMDGLVYGVCASLGFATLENFLYVGITGDYSTAILRSVTAVPCHACLGAIMGYYVGMGKFSDNPAAWRRKAWLFPVVLHGLYNLPLMWMVFHFGETGPSYINPFIFFIGCTVATLAVLIFSLILTRRLGNRLSAIQQETVVLENEDRVD
jgi:RsiW-degrading membrane proteinase PrsW (M82 family)